MRRIINYLEGDPDFGDTLEQAFRIPGVSFEITSVFSGKEYFRALAAGYFELVIIDFGTAPEAVLGVLKKTRKKRIETPVIVLLENNEIRIIRETLELGVLNHISKKDNYLEILPFLAENTICHYHSKRELEKLTANLQQSEKRYRDLIENIPDIIHSVNAEGRIIATNKRATEILGYTKKELLGMHIDQLYAPDRHENVVSGMETLKKGESIYGIESALITKDGRRIDVEISSTACYSEDGEFIETRSVLRDITDRKNAERALHNSEMMFREVVDNVLEYIYRFEYRDGILVSAYHSARCMYITGYTPDEYQQKPDLWMKRIYGKDLKKVKSFFEELVRIQKSKSIEYRIVHKDGTIRWVLNTCTVQVDEETNTIREFGFIVDISGNIKVLRSLSKEIEIREKAEQELREAMGTEQAANLAKSRFLAAMSHEIRTPMNAILGFADILLEDERDPGKINKLEIITQAGHHLLELINDILDFSKIEAGKVKFEKINFSLARMLEYIRSMFHIKAEEKKLGFELHVDPSVPKVVHGDERRIEQIIINLVGNAFKFTKKGKVELSCRYEKGRAVFRISDTGIGIHQNMQKEIFSPFIQENLSSSREYEGTGLGLAITRSLTEQMGGDVYLQSKAGTGSIFTIVLPLPEATGEPAENIGRWHDFETKFKKEKMVDAWLRKADGDKDIEKQIIKGIRVLPERINALETIIRDNDGPAIHKMAHDIKGFSGNYGMLNIHDLMEKIETEAGKNDCDRQILRQLMKEAKEIIAGIPDNYVALKETRPEFKVLVAEDNEMNRQLMGILLEKIGVDYSFAENGKIVLDILGEKKFDLLLLDMQMPVMDGLAVIKRIRQTDEIKDLYTIAITAHAIKGAAAEYRKAGCDDYISKPIDRRLLSEKITELMMNKSAFDGQGAAEPAKAVITESNRVIDGRDREEIAVILQGLKRNSRVFNPKEVRQLADRLSALQAGGQFGEAAESLYSAADDFDDESIPGIIRKIEATL